MKRCGLYEVHALIGSGGMGTVYRGRDPRFDRAVALKVLHGHLLRDADLVQRFRTEAVIQAKLNHPHVVRVHDFVDDGDVLALVMEYVEGEPLDVIIARSPHGLPSSWWMTVIEHVLKAIGYAHEHGLVHRDIKPSNILIETVDGRPFAKVADFGIAKVLGADKMKTATGAKMGTLAYMSPEQIRAPKHVDHRADIYSLGAVVYELLTGRAPFDSDTEYELMRLIVESPPRPMHAGGAPLGSGLDRVVQRALAKTPDARYQSCEAMITDLRRVTALDADGGPAGLHETAEHTPPPITRAPLPTVAETVLASAVAAPLVSRPRGRFWVMMLLLAMAIIIPFVVQHVQAGAREKRLHPASSYYSPPTSETAVPPRPSPEPSAPAPVRAEPRASVAIERSAQAASDAAISEDDVLAFWRMVNNATSERDVAQVGSFYGDEVVYFGQGRVSRAAVLKDKTAYFRRWPQIAYDLTGDIIIERTDGSGTVVRMPIHYETSNPERQESKSGETQCIWKLQRVNGRIFIAEEGEQILHRDGG